MTRISFEEIRARYPDQFLVLIDPEEVQLSPRWIEVVAARDVQVFGSGDEMFDAYRTLKHKGFSVAFCTPHYKKRFVIEQRYRPKWPIRVPRESLDSQRSP